MLTENRKYHFIGELTLKRSHTLDEKSQPKDDKVNWLFLNVAQQQFSFVYKIENVDDAKYNQSFKVMLSFTMIETVENLLNLDQIYEVLRGQEHIGIIKIIDAIK